MRIVSRISVLGLLSLLAVNPAAGRDLLVTSTISCPDSVQSGQSLTIGVHLENSECSSVDVRFFTAIAGNVDQSAGGLGIFGPQVAGSPSVVPTGTCPFSPGVLDLMLAASPTAPVSLEGQVGAYLLISEWEMGARRTTRVDHCFVEVIAP